MPKVLITGGTGFVGSWMRRTQPEGTNCLYVGRRHDEWKVVGYKGKGEADTWKDVEFSFGGYPKYIVHLAPIAPTESIELAKLNNIRLLYCSSGIVYHSENDTEYRRNKIKWEAECLASGVDVVITRLFTFSGEGLDDGKAIVQFERAAARGEPLRIWGDGSCVRSYMPGDEMGRRLWAVLLKGKSRESYDIGSIVPITMLDLAKRIIKEHNSKSEIIVEGGVDPMPNYLPEDAKKTDDLLEQ